MVRFVHSAWVLGVRFANASAERVFNSGITNSHRSYISLPARFLPPNRPDCRNLVRVHLLNNQLPDKHFLFAQRPQSLWRFSIRPTYNYTPRKLERNELFRMLRRNISCMRSDNSRGVNLCNCCGVCLFHWCTTALKHLSNFRAGVRGPRCTSTDWKPCEEFRQKLTQFILRNVIIKWVNY